MLLLLTLSPSQSSALMALDGSFIIYDKVIASSMFDFCTWLSSCFQQARHKPASSCMWCFEKDWILCVLNQVMWKSTMFCDSDGLC